MSGDVLSIHNERNWRNALIALGHSDAEKLLQQGIRLRLTKEEATQTADAVAAEAALADRLAAMRLQPGSPTTFSASAPLAPPRLVHPKYKVRAARCLGRRLLGR